MQDNNILITKNTCIFPYFGGLKDSPTCRHNLQEVTYPQRETNNVQLSATTKPMVLKTSIDGT